MINLKTGTPASGMSLSREEWTALASITPPFYAEFLASHTPDEPFCFSPVAKTETVQGLAALAVPGQVGAPLQTSSEFREMQALFAEVFQ